MGQRWHQFGAACYHLALPLLLKHRHPYSSLPHCTPHPPQWRPSLATRALCRWSACTPSRCGAAAAAVCGCYNRCCCLPCCHAAVDLPALLSLLAASAQHVASATSQHRLFCLLCKQRSSCQPPAWFCALPPASDGWLAEDEWHGSHRRLHRGRNAAADQRRRRHRCGARWYSCGMPCRRADTNSLACLLCTYSPAW